jgi:CRISPR/Cas system CMR subunit Cmr4 (Cas7 group RAMP superfamily)
MKLDPIEHFDTHDFFDSELLVFDYDKNEKQLKLTCNYVLDRITAVLNQENDADADSLHEYVFRNVNLLKRRNVTAFPHKKNSIDTFIEQISINLDAITIKKGDNGFKIKIAFLDAFGEASFQCEQIDFRFMTN